MKYLSNQQTLERTYLPFTLIRIIFVKMDYTAFPTLIGSSPISSKNQ